MRVRSRGALPKGRRAERSHGVDHQLACECQSDRSTSRLARGDAGVAPGFWGGFWRAMSSWRSAARVLLFVTLVILGCAVMIDLFNLQFDAGVVAVGSAVCASE